MARRHDVRRVKIHRSYSIQEAAQLLGVHKLTVRRWIVRGLPLIEDKRPYLIHGSDLRGFLAAQRPRKQACGPGRIYCLRCRKAVRPALDMAEYIPKTPTRGLLAGICPACEGLIYRASSLAKLAAASGDLVIAFRSPEERLKRLLAPLPECCFGADPR